jgi:hypothetical protein
MCPQFKEEFFFVKFACKTLWAVAIITMALSSARETSTKTNWIFTQVVFITVIRVS